jgi:hypothetical protein
MEQNGAYEVVTELRVLLGAGTVERTGLTCGRGTAKAEPDKKTTPMKRAIKTILDNERRGRREARWTEN